MRQLFRWPNGETRIIDVETMMASEWLRYTPQGPLSSIPLEFLVGEPAETSTPEAPKLGKFKNTAYQISSKASEQEWLEWMPGGAQVIRVEGGPPGTDYDADAPVDVLMRPVRDPAGERMMLSKLRSQMLHSDADDE